MDLWSWLCIDGVDCNLQSCFCNHNMWSKNDNLILVMMPTNKVPQIGYYSTNLQYDLLFMAHINFNVVLCLMLQQLNILHMHIREHVSLAFWTLIATTWPPPLQSSPRPSESWSLWRAPEPLQHQPPGSRRKMPPLLSELLPSW